MEISAARLLLAKLQPSTTIPEGKADMGEMQYDEVSRNKMILTSRHNPIIFVTEV